MAYATTTPPVLIVQALQGGIKQWTYSSTADAVATVAGAGYFTNAQLLGMAVNDLVIVIGSSGVASFHRVITVTSTGADLSDATVIGSTANAG